VTAPCETHEALRYPFDQLLGAEANVRLLRLLASEAAGSLTAPEAAKRVGLTPQGARRAIGRLVRSGLVVRVGGGRSQQYALTEHGPIATALRDLFRVEEARYASLLAALRGVFGGVAEVRAAWIESMPARFDRPLEVFLVVEAAAISWVKDEIRTRLLEVEREFDVLVEFDSYTVADAPTPDPDESLLLAGVFPQNESPPESRQVLHSEREERALRMSRGIARLLRTNPSLAKRARSHVDRLVHEGQGMATSDLLEWRNLLDTYSIERLCDFLGSDSSRARRLRQSSPFFAVLSPSERDALQAFLEGDR
jgi:DNA-binding Lrp family transcriptional regulator